MVVVSFLKTYILLTKVVQGGHDFSSNSAGRVHVALGLSFRLSSGEEQGL